MKIFRTMAAFFSIVTLAVLILSFFSIENGHFVFFSKAEIWKIGTNPSADKIVMYITFVFNFLFFLLSFIGSLVKSKKTNFFVIILGLLFLGFISYHFYFIYHFFYLINKNVYLIDFLFSLFSIFLVFFLVVINMILISKQNEQKAIKNKKEEKIISKNDELIDASDSHTVLKDDVPFNLEPQTKQQVNINETQQYNVSDSQTVLSERERILRLKKELDQGFEEEYTEDDSLTNNIEVLQTNEIISSEKSDSDGISTVDLREMIKKEEEEIHQDYEKWQELKRNKDATSYDTNTLKDPYKQTILPRRNIDSSKINKYINKPIGNSPINIPEEVGFKKHNKSNLVNIKNYENKIFLGDSDRIWEILKKQDRSILKKTMPKLVVKKNEDYSLNDSNNIDQKKENLRQFEAFDNNLNDSLGKVNNDEKSDYLTEEVPTIDWDD